MKYSYLACSRLEYLRKDSTIDFVIYSLQRMSAPSRLKTMRQIVQLTAFRTYNSSSKSKAFSPVNVYLLILDRP